MKKNLLFVIPSLIAGGGQKSLINLLKLIDYGVYNVDLFIFNKDGLFINSIPKEVNILELPSNYRMFCHGLFTSIRNYCRTGQLGLAYSRLMFSIKNKAIRDKAASEQYTWKYQSQSFDVMDKKYDAAIGYLEKSPIYYIVDKVNSPKKIGWIHTNYSNSGMDNRFDNPYFQQLSHIVTVSEECSNSLKATFSQFSSKVKVIYNIVSPSDIVQLANGDLQNDFIVGDEYTNIVTVARLSSEKGIDLAVKACEILVNKGYKIRWYVLGDGGERGQLETLIQEKGLHDHFKLLGIKENPYPYMRKADIYVQPSRYEGKSIAIDEAKILHTPIVVTNFDTAKDQIAHERNGIIVEMNEHGLSDGIEKLITDPELKRELIRGLSEEKLGTEDEIHKLYELFKR